MATKKTTEERLDAIEAKLNIIAEALNIKEPKQKIRAIRTNVMRDGGSCILKTKNEVYRYDGGISSKSRGRIFLGDETTKLKIDDFEIVDKL